MDLGVVIRSAASVTPTWTTAALIAAGCRQGHRLWIVEQRDIGIDAHRIVGRAFRFDPDSHSDPDHVAQALVRRTATRARIDMGRLDRLLMRCAPLDPTLLSLVFAIEDLGVPVVNRPAGMARVLSKAWLASHDLPTPITTVTRSRAIAETFHEAHGAIIVKPDRGSGGAGVHLVGAEEHDALHDAFTHARRNGGLVVLQPCIVDPRGERRLVVCDGEILGGYVRVSAPGEFRHNLKRGATPRPLTPDPSDHAVVAAVTPLLERIGIRFAGLDVLGGRLVEINAINPGGTVHADALHGSQLADRVVRQLTRVENRHDGLASPPDEEAGGRPDRPR